MAACAPCPRSAAELPSFDRAASGYEATRPLPDRVAAAVARRVARDVAPGAWVLDAGFGTGRLGRALARRHPQTVGIDLSRAMLDEGRRRSSEPLKLVQGDLAALPFADHAFDAALSVHVLHLIPDWHRALAELARVLVPGGTLWLGFEERRTRGYVDAFLTELASDGLLPPHPGASAAEIEAHLRREGWKVRWERHCLWTWRVETPVAQTLAALENRAYSRLWEIPEALYRPRLEAFRRRVTETAAGSAAVETTRMAMALLAATPPESVRVRSGSGTPPPGV